MHTKNIIIRSTYTPEIQKLTKFFPSPPQKSRRTFSTSPVLLQRPSSSRQRHSSVSDPERGRERETQERTEETEGNRETVFFLSSCLSRIKKKKRNKNTERSNYNNNNKSNNNPSIPSTPQKKSRRRGRGKSLHISTLRGCQGHSESLRNPEQAYERKRKEKIRCRPILENPVVK